LVVLLYHQVGGVRPSAVNLTPGRFREQLAHLREGGAVCTLDDGLDALRRGGAVDGVSEVVVTFDDGTADFVDVALPLLEQFRVPATLYLATKWIDEGKSFWDDGAVLSWSALRDALATGLVTIGSHTHSHALLDRLPPSEVADELDRSIELIEDNLGVTPRHFAYPKALPPARAADRAVRDRFESAALARTRPNPYRTTDPYLLTRSPIQVGDGMVWFRRKVDGGLRLEDDLREVVNRRRYASATR
jgi:peptidoglycan/xylan/chitin deacetylase (PgdA/CDA1 family)